MADLTKLQQSVDTLKSETAAALDRISVDVAELKRRIPDDSAVQAEIDAIKDKVDAVSASLRVVDPLPDFPPAE